tara:strand:+ start:256 stop:519 length:264 start_codon:yes stop_codon:yes gene_type:complete
VGQNSPDIRQTRLEWNRIDVRVGSVNHIVESSPTTAVAFLAFHGIDFIHATFALTRMQQNLVYIVRTSKIQQHCDLAVGVDVQHSLL